MLGVDQGSATLGLALMDGPQLVTTWRVHAAGTDAHERLRIIGRQLENLAGVIRERGAVPDVIAIESVAVGVNMRTALKMAETRGFLLAIFQRHFPSSPVRDVNLAQTKIAVGLPGNTRREIAKPATIAYIAEHFGLELPEDEADAVAVALAGARLEDLRGAAPATTTRTRSRRRTQNGPAIK